MLHTYEELEKQPEYDLTDDGELIERNQNKGDSWEEALDVRSEEEKAADDEDVGEVRQMLRDIQVKTR